MLSLTLVGLLGLIDYWSGAELSLSIFYLLPIGLTAWVMGGRWAMVTVTAATLSWLWADAGGGAYLSPAVVYWNACIRFIYFSLVGYLLHHLRSALAAARTMSRTDSLTGALNKLAFKEVAQEELERVKRYEHPLSIAYIDLDNFKHVNDTRGHAAGDELLSVVVKTLKRVMRKTDAVARLGGDEFAIIMIETREAEARRAFLKAQASLLSAMQERNWPVTFSVGIVTYLEPPGSVNDMLVAADTLMYTAKHSGKNRVAYQVVASTRSPKPRVAVSHTPGAERSPLVTVKRVGQS